jgi:Spy/CpxP family protein refolding chaperone
MDRTLLSRIAGCPIWAAGGWKRGLTARPLTIGMLGLLLLAVLATSVDAQGRGGRGRGGFGQGGFGGGGFGRGGFGGGGLLGALRDEDLQRELGITDEQRTAIEALSENAPRPDFGQLRDLSDEERQAALAKLRDDMEQLRQQSEAKLKDILQPEQYTRLQETSWQRSGARALLDESLAGELQLTEEQKTQIREILETRGGAGGGRSGRVDGRAADAVAGEGRRPSRGRRLDGRGLVGTGRDRTGRDRTGLDRARLVRAAGTRGSSPVR